MQNNPTQDLYNNPHYQQRFSGIGRLYGHEALRKLSQGHFVVAGLGGVGTWAAEALARSGVGEITLIDLDDICITNTNRQLHALNDTIGHAKTTTMTQRLKGINPDLSLHSVDDFLDKENIPELITPKHDVVIDATDSSHIKAALVAYCRARRISLITVGSAGGKQDPSAVTTRDLGRTCSDPMLAKVRQQLYRLYNFARDKNRKFRVDAVYSTEQMVYPKPSGEVCQQKSVMTQQEEGASVKLDCTSGFGSSTMVTGTFGFMAASKAIERYLKQQP